MLYEFRFAADAAAGQLAHYNFHRAALRGLRNRQPGHLYVGSPGLARR
jgi:hypothetical protein